MPTLAGVKANLLQLVLQCVKAGCLDNEVRIVHGYLLQLSAVDTRTNAHCNCPDSLDLKDEKQSSGSSVTFDFSC